MLGVACLSTPRLAVMKRSWSAVTRILAPIFGYLTDTSLDRREVIDSRCTGVRRFPRGTAATRQGGCRVVRSGERGWVSRGFLKTAVVAPPYLLTRWQLVRATRTGRPSGRGAAGSGRHARIGRSARCSACAPVPPLGPPGPVPRRGPDRRTAPRGTGPGSRQVAESSGWRRYRNPGGAASRCGPRFRCADRGTSGTCATSGSGRKPGRSSWSPSRPGGRGP